MISRITRTIIFINDPVDKSGHIQVFYEAPVSYDPKFKQFIGYTVPFYESPDVSVFWFGRGKQDEVIMEKLESVWK